MALRTNDELFAEGIELFNRGRFFECHEVLEELWKRMRGPERIFIQGIIQAAAALLHLERGNASGAARLYTKAKAKLKSAPAVYKGLQIERLRVDLELCFATPPGGEPFGGREVGARPASSAKAFPQLHRAVPAG